jgi:putative RNA 2'-phosphotransferase
MTRRQEQKETALVRMLAYGLAVAPHELGLRPDPEGWVPVKELLKALHEDEGWRHVREAMLLEAATRLAPEQLELTAGRMRCRGRTPPLPEYGLAPPAHLYYGARRKAYAVIRERGLEAKEGGNVVLAADQEWGMRLGRRRDAEPILVTVQARRAQDQGVAFALWGTSLWLADWIPADCLLGPPVSDDLLPAKRPAKPAPPPPPAHAPAWPSPDSMPGSFLLNSEDAVKPYKRKGIKKDIEWKKDRHKDKRRGD